jgi:TPR repeat protein
MAMGWCLPAAHRTHRAAQHTALLIYTKTVLGGVMTLDELQENTNAVEKLEPATLSLFIEMAEKHLGKETVSFKYKETQRLQPYPDTLTPERDVTDTERISAAKDGNKYAQYALAALIAEPSGKRGYGDTNAQVEGDGFILVKLEEKVPEALAWYKLSAAQDFAPAQYALGQMYKAELGAANEGTREAVVLFRRAALNLQYEGTEWNHRAFAMVALGSILYDGTPHVEQNRTEALEWFHKAAEYRFVPALNTTVTHYEAFHVRRIISTLITPST